MRQAGKKGGNEKLGIDFIWPKRICYCFVIYFYEYISTDD